MKICRKCGNEFPLSEYYNHKAMKDGHLNICISCVKLTVKSRYLREESRLKIAEYERSRFKSPLRKALLKKYEEKSRIKNPEKYKARTALSNAVRDKRIFRMPCVHCGNPKSQGHHEDYSKPLEVKWCCFKCHREIEHGQKTLPIQSI